MSNNGSTVIPESTTIKAPAGANSKSGRFTNQFETTNKTFTDRTPERSAYPIILIAFLTNPYARIRINIFFPKSKSDIALDNIPYLCNCFSATAH